MNDRAYGTPIKLWGMNLSSEVAITACQHDASTIAN